MNVLSKSTIDCRLCAYFRRRIKTYVSSLFLLSFYYLLFCTDIYGNLPDEVIKDSVHLGLHRSDYMINVDEDGSETPLQVEINTIASSFGCLSKKVGDFHLFMLQRNANFPAYQNLLKQTSGDSALLEVIECLSCATPFQFYLLPLLFFLLLFRLDASSSLHLLFDQLSNLPLFP